MKKQDGTLVVEGEESHRSSSGHQAAVSHIQERPDEECNANLVAGDMAGEYTCMRVQVQSGLLVQTAS